MLLGHHKGQYCHRVAEGEMSPQTSFLLTLTLSDTLRAQQKLLLLNTQDSSVPLYP